MKKKLWAVMLATAVAMTSVEVVPYMDVQVAVAATKKPSAGAEVADTSTDGRTTAAGYTFNIVGTEATITGYNGTSKELTIPTKITVTREDTSSGSTTPSKKATNNNKNNTTTNSTDYSVTAIAANAFSERVGISTVTMSGGTDATGKVYGIKTIGDKAFFACHDLASLTIAATTDSIGKNAFSDCAALNSIKVSDGNKKYKMVDGGLYSYATSSGTGSYVLVQYPLGSKNAEYTVPESIATTLVEIGEGAFWGAANLETITLPQTVAKVNDSAFAECKKLKTVNFPEGLQSLGKDAFKGDTALEEVTIPSDITILDQGTFQGCETLKKVNMDGAKLRTIGARAFQGCQGMEEFIVPAGVTTIGDQAFAQCESLRQITIPITTTSIGSNILTGTTATVLCHNGSRAATYAKNNGITVERTYTISFYTNNSYKILLSSQEVQEGKDAVPPAYEGLDGYQMSWSGSYTNVYQDARLYPVQRKLFQVTFEDSYNGQSQAVKVAEGDSPEPPAWSMDGYTLLWDTVLPVTIHEDMTIQAIWQNNTTGEILKAGVKRPENVGTELVVGKNRYRVISSRADAPTVKFVGTVTGASLKSIVIPATITSGDVTYKVKEIAKKALEGDKTVTSVVIGKNVDNINAKAFYQCTKLKKVKIKTKDITTMGKKAFGKINKKARFYTFNSRLSRYKSMLKKAGVKKPVMKRL